ncbi:hypothetical protein, partial [Sphingobium xenophagum]|uniref:hypothetical protein n=1 Tax=Sphingobium xenophagum TaxID=121428 RepID=UPI001C3F4E00
PVIIGTSASNHDGITFERREATLSGNASPIEPRSTPRLSYNPIPLIKSPWLFPPSAHTPASRTTKLQM